MQRPEPQILNLPPKTLVGLRMISTLAVDQTPTLWRTFMPRHREIQATAPERYAVRVFPEGFFERLDPERPFEIWAGIESSGPQPEGMEALTLSGGLYAAFTYQGLPQEYPPVFQYLLQVWMPKNGLAYDYRPHVAVMGDRYVNSSPDSEEEMWIPVRNR